MVKCNQRNYKIVKLLSCIKIIIIIIIIIIITIIYRYLVILWANHMDSN